MNFTAWDFAILSCFSLWGVMVFLRVVASEIKVHEDRMDAERQAQKRRSQREARIPVAVAAPIQADPLGGQG